MGATWSISKTTRMTSRFAFYRRIERVLHELADNRVRVDIVVGTDTTG